MGKGLLLLIVLALFYSQKEVDAFNRHEKQQQATERRAQEVIVKSPNSFTVYDEVSPLCNTCQDCTNTTFSYLCGRLQCQCFDSVETCTLIVDEIDTYDVNLVQLNATNKAYLGPTTLTGKILLGWVEGDAMDDVWLGSLLLLSMLAMMTELLLLMSHRYVLTTC